MCYRCAGARKALNRGAHGRLQLHYRGGIAVFGVDSFAVFEHGQRQEALVCGDGLFESVEPQPQVVGVEVYVLVNVLKAFFVFSGAALRGFA